MSTITCPHCDGKRQVYAFLNHGPDYRTHTSGYVQCSTCQGMGAITTEHAERIKTGKRVQAERIERGESLNDAARRLGISPAELSARERGRA